MKSKNDDVAGMANHSEEENKIVAERKEKLKKIKENHGEPYPNKHKPSARAKGIIFNDDARRKAGIDEDFIWRLKNFRSDFLKIIDSLDKKNKSAILVGGTMMYFHALFNGISVLPKSNPKIRKKLDEEQKKLGLKHLFNKLKKLDKESVKNIHENDQQRIKRSLEIYLLTGKTHTELKKNMLNPFLNRNFMNFAIVPENKKIFKKDLRERFIKMLDDGLIEETKFLIDKFSKNIKILSSVGYKQVLEYLENKISEEEMIEKATNANYQLSKRQITWLKKFELKETFFANQSNMVIKILNYLE